MVDGSRNIKDLSLDELNAVIEAYPWFGQARKELCERMSTLGEVWTGEQYADAALHICSRRILFELKRRSKVYDYSDKDVEALLERYFAQPSGQEGAVEAARSYRGVGDYFSAAAYKEVRKGDDNIFSSFASKESGHALDSTDLDEFTGFCTETLAQVYLEQGFPEHAKSIYSKLILRYPEKSAYFASLIEKIDKII